MRTPLTLLAVAVPLLGACDSKVTSTRDIELQNRVETLQDCFPELFAKTQALLAVAETWRLNSSTVVPDPAGASWSQQGDGSITVSLPVDGATLTATIRFYSPTGVEQNLDLSAATSLSDAIDRAAGELRTLFGDTDKFLVAAWSISGGGIAATGEGLTGILGGTSGEDELEQLRTTEVTPVGGPPPVDSSTITETGTGCSLTFTIPSLVIDASPTQQYPIGTITLQVVGPLATISGSVEFDGTAAARITVDSVPGRFAFDVETRALSYLP